MTIIEKLAKIQAELKAPKNQYNEFGKYKYRNAEDILEAVKPLAANVQAVVLLTDEIITIGNRYYVKTTATLKDNESEISVTANAREEEAKKGMDGSQVTGAASSYARKYALNGLFAIDDTKDADSQNNATESPAKAKKTNTGKSSTETKKPALTLEKAYEYEVAIKGVNYKLKNLSDGQLEWLSERAKDELKQAVDLVFADRVKRQEEYNANFFE